MPQLAAVGGEAAAGSGAAAGGGAAGAGAGGSMLGGLGRGLIIGKLFGGGGEKQPKPSASETISSTMQALNPVQFG